MNFNTNNRASGGNSTIIIGVVLLVVVVIAIYVYNVWDVDAPGSSSNTKKQEDDYYDDDFQTTSRQVVNSQVVNSQVVGSSVPSSSSSSRKKSGSSAPVSSAPVSSAPVSSTPVTVVPFLAIHQLVSEVAQETDKIKFKILIYNFREPLTSPSDLVSKTFMDDDGKNVEIVEELSSQQFMNAIKMETSDGSKIRDDRYNWTNEKPSNGTLYVIESDETPNISNFTKYEVTNG